MKIITIHQPEAFPWAGFFNKMMISDKYVVLDNVDYRKNYFQNRNQILTGQGAKYLTVPVNSKDYRLIKDVRIRHDSNWKKKHLSAIKQSYAKSFMYSTHIDFFISLYEIEYELLIDFNISFPTE